MEESPLSEHKTINVTPQITHKLECNFYFNLRSKAAVSSANKIN